MTTINHIAWHVTPKDYSEQLAKVKAEMGASCKSHPDHDPLNFPWQYEPWQLDIIEAKRNLKH